MLQDIVMESTAGTHGEVAPGANDAVRSEACARLLVVCHAWGQPSEVWMRRQVSAIRRLRASVACWESAAPHSTADLAVIPFDATPYDGRGRWLFRCRNLIGRNFYGTVGVEAAYLRRLLRAQRPDVILCHYGMTALRVLPEARRLGIPLVAHCNGIDLSGALENRWYRWSLRRWAREFDAFVVVADYMRQYLIDQQVDSSRIHVIPYGVPVDDLTPARALAEQPCRFIFVGRFVEKKAPLLVLRAFEQCSRQVPGVTLTMAGAGPLLDNARALAVELGVSQLVNFTGGLTASQVADVMADAGAYVQHSLTAPSGDKEGWPVAVAESMAAGLPVIATRHAEIPRQVVDGVTGFLVDERDWTAMGDAMAAVARDPLLRTRMGAAGRERARLHFDLAYQVERLEEALLSVRRR